MGIKYKIVSSLEQIPLAPNGELVAVDIETDIRMPVKVADSGGKIPTQAVSDIVTMQAYHPSWECVYIYYQHHGISPTLVFDWMCSRRVLIAYANFEFGKTAQSMGLYMNCKADFRQLNTSNFEDVAPLFKLWTHRGFNHHSSISAPASFSLDNMLKSVLGIEAYKEAEKEKLQTSFKVCMPTPKPKKTKKKKEEPITVVPQPNFPLEGELDRLLKDNEPTSRLESFCGFLGLKAEQIAYCCFDVVYLHDLYNIMVERINMTQDEEFLYSVQKEKIKTLADLSSQGLHYEPTENIPEPSHILYGLFNVRSYVQVTKLFVLGKKKVDLIREIVPTDMLQYIQLYILTLHPDDVTRETLVSIVNLINASATDKKLIKPAIEKAHGLKYRAGKVFWADISALKEKATEEIKKTRGLTLEEQSEINLTIGDVTYNIPVNTSAPVLKYWALQKDNEVVTAVTEVKQALKGYSYHAAYLAYTKDNKKVYGLYSPSTKTGRTSSDKQNVQNIPNAWRKHFIASKGKFYIYVDFNNLEMRTLTMFTGSEKLQNIFANGGDMHIFTATHLFGAEKAKENRQLAKVLNFGLIYGMGVGALRARIFDWLGLLLPIDEVEEMRTGWFNLFPAVRQSHSKLKSIYRGKTKLYCIYNTLFGQPLFPVTYTNVLNYPIQGLGADLATFTLIDIYNKLTHLDASVVNFMHDSFLIESTPEELDVALNIVGVSMLSCWDEFLMRVLPERGDHNLDGYFGLPAEIFVMKTWNEKEAIMKRVFTAKKQITDSIFYTDTMLKETNNG